MTRPASVVVVEDENVIALDLKSTLTKLGYVVPALASSGAEAVRTVTALDPDLVLMDVRLRGGMDGVEAAAAIRACCDVPVIYLTAYADPGTVERARSTEPYGYLLKPFDERELGIVIEMALQRHQTARKLRDNERWLAITLRSIGDGVIAADGDWRIRFMNPQAEKLTGWQASSAIGRELADVLRVAITMPPRPLPSGDGFTGGGVAGGVLTALDGREVPIEESSTTMRDDAGKVVGSVVAIRATDRYAAPARHDRDESELQRIVLEMHDGPVQDILTAAAQLQLLLPRATSDPDTAQRVRRASRVLDRALDELRGFFTAFGPLELEQRPLGQILEALAEQHRRATEQTVELSAAPDLGDCALATKIALCRILQESLANAQRHSGTSHERVSIERHGGWITLSVADDGRGFDPAATLADAGDVGGTRRRSGLRGIEDWVTMLAGSFALDSAPGRGTTVTVTLPVA